MTGYLDLTVRHLRVLEVLAQRARADPAHGALQDEILDRVHRRNTRFVARPGRRDELAEAAVTSYPAMCGVAPDER